MVAPRGEAAPAYGHTGPPASRISASGAAVFPRGTTARRVDHGGVDCLVVSPPAVQAERVLLYIHGGGFVFGSPDTHKAMAAQLALRIGAQAVLPRYRLAPESPFPAAPEDVRAVWDVLVADGIAPKNIVLGGDSAVGALAFGLIGALCAQGMALPGVVFGLSPLADLTFGGDSFARNADNDAVLPAERAAALAELFLRGARGDVPLVSPLFASFKGGPPAWVTVGDTEILLDDARGLVARLQADGVEAHLVERRDLPHVWPFFHNILAEARETLDDFAQWIKQQQGWAV